ncbi:MAG: hypothetical protein ER33_09015 [Cyanobium sp. CACIAM 14]|nr:MAG: hypothetical protein ER33_09015 [Cyanobium sp. CACIAM 14]
MASQWQNFLRNLGEWRGSFTGIAADGTQLESTPSVLTLAGEDDDRLVRFTLRRWPAGTAMAAGGGPAEAAGAPSRAIEQEYRSLGRQVVFFASGAFSKGSLQVAPNTAFGGEFGFIGTDRRHRLVQLYKDDGTFDQLVLIREFRAGSGAAERPPASAEQLVGAWSGQAATISADWPEPELAESRWDLGAAEIEGLRLLPDGGFCRLPQRVSHREAFVLEGGWLPAPGRMERLIRRYDASGAWISATHEVLSRTAA